MLHADVIRSFSWSTNICGEKRWYLVPPEQSFLLYDCFGRQLASHLEVDVQNPGLQVFFPGLALVRKYAIQIMQQAGETLFVPSNWFHTVENTQDTLSINHNWVNRANILLVWQHVESELRNYRTNHVVGPGIDLSYKSTNGETINPMTRTASANRSQIDDDLHLLWHVLSTKAMSILDHSHILDANAISDLETILCILDKILAFQMEDKRPDVQTTLDVTSLRIQVATAICAVH